jgi:hypothetical protein
MTKKIFVETGTQDYEISGAFEKIISAMKSNYSLYDCYFRTYSRDEDKFTTQGLADLAGNHLFDDRPDLFGITEHEGHCIREYFQNRTEPHLYINELWEAFPDSFDGESSKFIKDISKINPGIILFDDPDFCIAK